MKQDDQNTTNRKSKILTILRYIKGRWKRLKSQQPAPLDTPKTPLTETTAMAPNRTTKSNKGKRSRDPGMHRCFYCGVRGHHNYQCGEPHFRCPLDGQCTVPLKHPNFDKACSLGLRTATNNAPKTFLKGKRRPYEREDTPIPVRPEEGHQLEDGGLPPAGSLLFAPNPVTPISDAELFRPSPYQVAPIPGQWGNGQWGDPWVENPVLLVHLHIRHPPHPTMVKATKDPSSDHEDYDWLRYAEDDLPGAIYHYDDDPFAPTAARVAENTLVSSLNRRVRDMGISG
jgi:hypothetical protein